MGKKTEERSMAADDEGKEEKEDKKEEEEECVRGRIGSSAAMAMEGHCKEGNWVSVRKRCA